MLLFVCKSFAQIYKDFNKLNHVYEYWELGGCDTLYYTENIRSSVLDSTINLISSNKTFKLHDLYMGKDTVPFTITVAEQDYLIAELNKLKTFTWPTKLFPKSKRIAENQLSSAFAVTDRYPEEKYESCSVIYSFSKPIFLRNGTICLYIDQAIFSATNIRLFTQFFTQIDGKWEEYADVYTRFNDVNLKPNTALDEMAANLLKSQVQEDLLLSNRLEPETLAEFGKRVFSMFQSGEPEKFNVLFPTMAQSVILANEIGIASMRTASNEVLELNQISLLFKFSYDCLTTLEAAKTLKVDWTNSTFLSAVTSETQTAIKDKGGNPLLIKNVGIGFKDGLRRFNIKLNGVFLANKVWKVLSVEGIEEKTTN